MRIEKYKESQNWAVYDENDNLICVAVYKKGALNVMQLIKALMPQNEVLSHV